MCMRFARTYVSKSTHEVNTHEAQKNTLDFLEVDLMMMVSYHVGAGKQTDPLQKQSLHPVAGEFNISKEYISKAK